MANEHSSNKGEEDVVELKRALATGSASTQSNSASASACMAFYVYHIMFSLRSKTLSWHTVAPIVCYCMASILMTVVNKVSNVYARIVSSRSKLTLTRTPSLSCQEANST